MLYRAWNRQERRRVSCHNIWDHRHMEGRNIVAEIMELNLESPVSRWG